MTVMPIIGGGNQSTYFGQRVVVARELHPRARLQYGVALPLALLSC